MSHRWQKQQPGRRSLRRRQLLRPSGLCLDPHLQRHPGKREGWLPSFLCVADKRVCRNVHERSSSLGLASLVSFNSMIWPLSYARVSSWLNRSRLRMMVSPSASPSSLNSSTYLTDRQCAMWRVSPSPKKPLSMPLQANRPTWPLCNGVTGRPVIFCCLRTRMPRAFCIATERCSASSTRLEDDLQAVLHFAGVARHRCLTQVCGRSVARDDVVGGAADLVQPTGIGRSAIYRSRDRSTVGSVDGATVEVGVVEQIEEVHAELDAEPLAPHLPVLVYREVGVDKPRSVAVAHRLQVIRNRSDLVTDQGHRIGVQHLSSGRALLTGIATR